MILPKARASQPRAPIQFLGFSASTLTSSASPKPDGYTKDSLPHEFEFNEGWIKWLRDFAELRTDREAGRRGTCGNCGPSLARFADRVKIDPSVVRGLEYYTGPVFEAEITIPVVNEDGQTVRFGSVGGGGRYDGLVERFLGTKVPATGFSIGVSRLQAALAAINKDKPADDEGPVVVLVMEKDRLADYQKMAQSLRQAGIRAEMYLGTAGMKAQMKYADKRGAPCVVIQGGDERAKGEVQIKDLIEGAKAAATIKDSKEWREGRPAQVSVPEADLVTAVRDLLARHKWSRHADVRAPNKPRAPTRLPLEGGGRRATT